MAFTESIAELDGQLYCKVFGKIHYGCLGRSVSDNAGKGSEQIRSILDGPPPVGSMALAKTITGSPSRRLRSTTLRKSSILMSKIVCPEIS